MKRISILVCTTVLCLPLILTGCDDGAEEQAKLQLVEKELADLKTSSQTTAAERDRLKTELTDVTKERNTFQTQVTSLTEQVSKLSEDEKTLRGRIEELTASSNRLDGDITKLTESIDALKKQLTQVTASRDRLQIEVADLKKTRDLLQTQVTALIKQRDAAIAREQQAQRDLAILTAQAKGVKQPISEPNDGLVSIAKNPREEEAPKEEAVKPPTVHSFASARTKVDKGQSVTLTWHVSNATKILIEPEIGSVSALGSKNVKPAKTTTYTLTATNDGGQVVETCKVEVR